MIDWEKAQEIVRLLEVVKEDSRRESLMVLLKAEGHRLPRAVPTDLLLDLHKLAEYIRLNTQRIE
jgi:hypothetical protein